MRRRPVGHHQYPVQQPSLHNFPQQMDMPQMHRIKGTAINSNPHPDQSSRLITGFLGLGL